MIKASQHKSTESALWPAEARERLRVAIKNYRGGMQGFASDAKIARSSLYAIVKGSAVPRQETLGHICEVLGIPVASIVGDPDLYEVPIINVKASAGSGAINPELVETGETLGFPLRWLKQQFPRLDKLRLMSVDGASMTPTLQPGGWVMIDIGDTAPRDGVSVVRHDGHLYAKRLKVEPNLIRLVSDNDAWPEELVDLTNEADREGFRIIGRAVWTGAKLTD